MTQNEIQVNQMRLKLLTKLAKTSYNNSCYETYASLAQLVEQQTLNLMVGGSTPLWRTKMIERVRTYNSYSLLINSILLCTNNNRKELEDGYI